MRLKQNSHPSYKMIGSASLSNNAWPIWVVLSKSLPIWRLGRARSFTASATGDSPASGLAQAEMNSSIELSNWTVQKVFTTVIPSTEHNRIIMGKIKIRRNSNALFSEN